MTINVTTDTSVLIKGLVPPRRRAKDQFLSEQLNLHRRSSEILKKVELGEYSNHVPLVALIEVASVVSRLTNEPKSVSLALSYVSENSKLYPDVYLLERSIEIGKETKASGFDVLFMACAEMNDSLLLTDDRKMYEKSAEYGLEVNFLRA
jgi:predicted nucleic acid-binding protein